jgi:hypothetical protein
VGEGTILTSDMLALLLGLESATLENSNRRLIVHLTEMCDGGPCPIHARSRHHMRKFPQNWRGDRGFMERMCPHGVGHPDPDCREADPVHGCDGCCTPPPRRAFLRMLFG